MGPLINRNAVSDLGSAIEKEIKWWKSFIWW